MRELKLLRLPWCDFLLSSEGSSLPGEPPRWILDRRSFSRHWPIGIPNTIPPPPSATSHQHVTLTRTILIHWGMELVTELNIQRVRSELRHWLLTVTTQVESRVTSSEFRDGRADTEAGSSQTSFGSPLLIISPPLPHSHMSEPSDVWDSPDQAAHYHTLTSHETRGPRYKYQTVSAVQGKNGCSHESHKYTPRGKCRHLRLKQVAYMFATVLYRIK